MLETNDLVHDDNQQMCQDLGGFLPEPRDEKENQFLDSLDADTFLLGLTDKVSEGHWVWDSDGSPVSWASWLMSLNGIKEPDGGLQQNCVAMIRKWQSHKPGHRSEGWFDIYCPSYEDLKNIPTSLVCQRNPGEFADCALGKISFFLNTL